MDKITETSFPLTTPADLAQLVDIIESHPIRLVGHDQSDAYESKFLAQVVLESSWFKEYTERVFSAGAQIGAEATAKLFTDK